MPARISVESVYSPNNEVKAEKGVNAELGFKQGYKFGNLMGFFDVAGFYTQYTDMIEFRFGFFDPNSYAYANSTQEILGIIAKGQMPVSVHNSTMYPKHASMGQR